MTPVSGVNQTIEGKDALRCYPNPASDNFVIDLSVYENPNIKIYAITGQLIYNRSARDDFLWIYAKTMKPGIYQVLLTDEKGNIYSQKLVLNN